MIDWFHRDCTHEHCYWMIPTEPCQQSKRHALKIDPDRKMNKEELEKKVYGVESYKKNPVGIFIPINVRE